MWHFFNYVACKIIFYDLKMQTLESLRPLKKKKKTFTETKIMLPNQCVYSMSLQADIS